MGVGKDPWSEAILMPSLQKLLSEMPLVALYRLWYPLTRSDPSCPCYTQSSERSSSQIEMFRTLSRSEWVPADRTRDCQIERGQI